MKHNAETSKVSAKYQKTTMTTDCREKSVLADSERVAKVEMYNIYKSACNALTDDDIDIIVSQREFAVSNGAGSLSEELENLLEDVANGYLVIEKVANNNQDISKVLNRMMEECGYDVEDEDECFTCDTSDDLLELEENFSGCALSLLLTRDKKHVIVSYSTADE